MNYLNEIKNFNNLIFKKQNIFYLILIFVIFSLDRISKIKILEDFNDEIYFVNNFLNLDLIWNIGIGFGFLSTESTIIYNLVTLLIGSVVGILIYVSLVSDNFDKLFLSFSISAPFLPIRTPGFDV